MTILNRLPRMQKRRRREGGIAVVELVLLMPLLILMLFGTVHFAGLFFLQNNMVNAARDVARRLAVGEISAFQAETSIKDQLSTWKTNFDIDIDVADPADPLDRDIVVKISVPIKEASIVEFLAVGNGVLKAEVTMRQE